MDDLLENMKDNECAALVRKLFDWILENVDLTKEENSFVGSVHDKALEKMYSRQEGE